RLRAREITEHVRFRHAAFAAGAANRGRIDVVLLDELSNGRAHLLERRARIGTLAAGAAARGRCFGNHSGRRRRRLGTRRLRWLGLRFRRADALRLCADLTGLEHGKHLPARDGRAVTYSDFLDYSISWRRNLENDFIRLEIDEIFVSAYGVTGLLVPIDQGCVSDGLGKLRNLDLDTHVAASMLKRASPAMTCARACRRQARRRPAPAAGEHATRGCRTRARQPPVARHRKAGARR